MKEKDKVMYLLIHQKMKEKSGKDSLISKENLFKMFGKVYHIPKRYRYVVLRELVNFKMVVIQDPQNIKVLKYNNHIENSSKIYKELGMF